jgi:hypothetical protein
MWDGLDDNRQQSNLACTDAPAYALHLARMYVLMYKHVQFGTNTSGLGRLHFSGRDVEHKVSRPSIPMLPI